MTTVARRPGLRACQRGVSLIETMIAAAVLLVGCGATMSLFSVAVAQISSQGDVGTRVTQYAQDKMEQLMVLSFEDSSTDTIVDSLPPTGGTGLGGLMAGGQTLGSTDPSAPAAGYVDYLDGSGQRTTDLSSASYIRQWSIATDSSATLKTITVRVGVTVQLAARGLPPNTTLVCSKADLQ
jgi:hypothetical protein